MGRVWVVGSLNVDRPWRVERHPAVGETVFGAVGAPVPGGKGLNQAVAAARMGAEVVLVGAVGDDDDGRWLRAVARREGIDTTNLGVDVHHVTGTALIVVAADGANTVTVAPGANAALTVDDLLVAAGDVVVAQLEVPEAAVVAAFAAAERVGAQRVLNPSPLPAGRELPAKALGRADVLVLNEHEAGQLAGTAPDHAGAADPMATAHRLAGSTRTVIVTLGAAGAVAVGPEGEVVVAGDGAAGPDVVDTTGAGDCFLGVLAGALAEGHTMATAIAEANRAAGVQVTRSGTVDAMPRRADLDGGDAGR